MWSSGHQSRSPSSSPFASPSSAPPSSCNAMDEQRSQFAIYPQRRPSRRSGRKLSRGRSAHLAILLAFVARQSQVNPGIRRRRRFVGRAPFSLRGVLLRGRHSVRTPAVSGATQGGGETRGAGQSTTHGAEEEQERGRLRLY